MDWAGRTLRRGISIQHTVQSSRIAFTYIFLTHVSYEGIERFEKFLFMEQKDDLPRPHWVDDDLTAYFKLKSELYENHWIERKEKWDDTTELCREAVAQQSSKDS